MGAKRTIIRPDVSIGKKRTKAVSREEELMPRKKLLRDRRKIRVSTGDSLKGRRTVIGNDTKFYGSRNIISAGERIGEEELMPRKSFLRDRRKTRISAEDSLKGRRTVIGNDTKFYGSRNIISAGERIGERNFISSKEVLKRHAIKGKKIAKVGTKAGSTAVNGVVKATGGAVSLGSSVSKAAYQYVENGLDNSGNQDETSLFYDSVGQAGKDITKKTIDTAYHAGKRVTRPIRKKIGERTRKTLKKESQKTAKRAVKVTKTTAKATAKVVKPVVKAVTAAAKAVIEKAVAAILENPYVLVAVLVIVVLIIISWQITLFITTMSEAPVAWADGDTGGVIEQTVDDYLLERIPELREEFLDELETRITELQDEGYNHIIIYNLQGDELGDNVIPADIREPDCGLISVEEYVRRIRPLYNSCLLAKYGETYTESEADEVLDEIFSMLSYRIEEPVDHDDDGTPDYIYCDGEIRVDNSEYSCPAYYKDSSGNQYTWPGMGGNCYNSSDWMEHDSKDVDNNPCDHERKYCSGHTRLDTSVFPFKLIHYSCDGCKTEYSCTNYCVCNGHKEIYITIGNGSSEDLLNEYFVNPIKELEEKGSLSEEEEKRLENLKIWYELAKLYLSNSISENEIP